MAKNIIKEDLAVLKEMYSQAGKAEHFEKKILPHIKSQEDVEDLVRNSFGDLDTRTAFAGTLTQNEFVEQFYNIYRQRVLTMLSGSIPYINMFLKDAPYSGSQGYVSQNIKVGKDFTFKFTEGTFNPAKRPAYLQVISTKIERQYADEISIAIIGRAASEEGGLNKYMNDRIALLEEDFVAEIREAMLSAIDTVQGKVVVITVPTELQAATMKTQKARYILENIIAELKYIKDNSEDYSDNGFVTRKKSGDLVAIWGREASAEIDVQAQAMLRDNSVMSDITVSTMADIPMEKMTTEFYVKFMTKNKIHYSNSVSVSGIDVINANMKGVYTKTVFTELDVVDTEPALTIQVVDAVEGAAAGRKSKVEKDLVKRVKSAKARRQKFYDALKNLYSNDTNKVETAPIDVIEEESKTL